VSPATLIAKGRVAAIGLVIALAVTVSLGGCSSSAASSAASSSAGSGAGLTGAAGSTSERLDAGQLTADIVAAIRRKGTAKLSTVGVMPMTGQLRMAGTGMDLEVAVGSTARPLRAIIVGGVGYLDLGVVVGARHWLKVAPGSTSGQAASLGLFQRLADPGSALRGLGGTVEAVRGGRSTLDGVQVTEYSVSLDARQMASLAPSLSPGEPGADLVRSATVTHYFVDAGWLPHKVVNESVREGGETTSTTITYSDWGRPVTIEAPAPADVREGSAL